MSAPVATEVGRRVRDLRRFLKMSQTALADASGATRNTITNIERGRHENIPVDLVVTMARALDAHPLDLMGGPGWPRSMAAVAYDRGWRDAMDSIREATKVVPADEATS